MGRYTRRQEAIPIACCAYMGSGSVVLEYLMFLCTRNVIATPMSSLSRSSMTMELFEVVFLHEVYELLELLALSVAISLKYFQ